MSNVLQKTEINGKEEIWIILWFLKVQCCSFEEDITKFSPIQCCCMVQCCRSRQKKRAFRVRASISVTFAFQCMPKSCTNKLQFLCH